MIQAEHQLGEGCSLSYASFAPFKLGVMGAAGVGVLARRERFVQITSGGSYSQQGLTTTCKDLMFEGNRGIGRV